jgi:hypothetical protein
MLRRPAPTTGSRTCATPCALPTAWRHCGRSRTASIWRSGRAARWPRWRKPTARWGDSPCPPACVTRKITGSDDRHFIATLGRFWACGAEPDLSQFWGEAKRRRVPLPTYPFQRSRYFVDPGKAQVVTEADVTAKRHENVTDFGYRIGWRVMPADCPVDVETELGAPLTWLVFADEAGLARAAVQRLRGAGPSRDHRPCGRRLRPDVRGHLHPCARTWPRGL